MTLANADIYIARIIGGVGDTAIIAQARDALKSAYEELLHQNNWSWLRVDTDRSSTVASCTPEDGDTGLVTTVTGGFSNLLVGQTVTGTDIPAGTLIASITDGENLVLDTAGTGTTESTCTFGGTIPIINGVAEYILPQRFWKPMSARLVSTNFRKLHWIGIDEWDSIHGDQTTQGIPEFYTVYDGRVFDAGDTEQSYLRLVQPPSAADVLLMRYYRQPDFTDTDVDVPQDFLYTFLDLAQIHLLMKKDATSRRIPILYAALKVRIARAISTDRNEGGDDQMTGFQTAQNQQGAFSGDIYPKNYLGR